MHSSYMKYSACNNNERKKLLLVIRRHAFKYNLPWRRNKVTLTQYWVGVLGYIPVPCSCVLGLGPRTLYTDGGVPRRPWCLVHLITLRPSAAFGTRFIFDCRLIRLMSGFSRLNNAIWKFWMRSFGISIYVAWLTVRKWHVL